MPNDGYYANVLDGVTGTLDDYAALTTWLTARNGMKYYFRSTDKIPKSLSGMLRPALIVRVARVVPRFSDGLQMRIALPVEIELQTEDRDQRNLLDFIWHVTMALAKETPRVGAFGLTYVMGFTMPEFEIAPDLRDLESVFSDAKWRAIGVCNVAIHLKPSEI